MSDPVCARDEFASVGVLPLDAGPAADGVLPPDAGPATGVAGWDAIPDPGAGIGTAPGVNDGAGIGTGPGVATGAGGFVGVVGVGGFVGVGEGVGMLDGVGEGIGVGAEDGRAVSQRKESPALTEAFAPDVVSVSTVEKPALGTVQPPAPACSATPIHPIESAVTAPTTTTVTTMVRILIRPSLSAASRPKGAWAGAAVRA